MSPSITDCWPKCVDICLDPVYKYMLETVCYIVCIVCAYMHVNLLLTSQSALHTAGENSSLSPERAIDSPFPY